MSRKRTKQYLMLLMVIGLVSIAAGGSGTFASFTAETANGGNTFATGTLYLHDTVNNTCTSESSATNSNVDPNSNGLYPGDHCDALFNFVTGAAAGPQSVALTLSNAGTLNAKGLSVASNDPGCASSLVYESNTTLASDVSAAATVLTVSPTTLYIRTGATIQITDGVNTETKTVVGNVALGATSITISTGLAHGYAAATPTQINSTPAFTGGGGNLCTNLEMTITESAFADGHDVTVDPVTGDTSGGLGCALGTPVVGGCTMAATPNLNSLPLYSAHTPSALTLSDLSGSTDPVTATGLDSKTPRYFVITLDPNTTNGDQGKKATFDLVWHMDQA